MRNLITIGLLLTILFLAGAAYAGIGEPTRPQTAVGQPQGISCPNPAVITRTVTRTYFTNPKYGWQKVPVEEKFLLCQACK